MRKALMTFAFCASTAMPLSVGAQGVPTVDTQNIAQTIRQLQNMLEDAGIQSDQLDALSEQVSLLQGHLDTANNLYDSLTGARDIVGLTMEGDLNDLLQGNMTGVLGTIMAGMNGDWSGLTGPRSVNMRTTMADALAGAGFNEGTVEELAGSNVPGARRVATAATSGARHRRPPATPRRAPRPPPCRRRPARLLPPRRAPTASPVAAMAPRMKR